MNGGKYIIQQNLTDKLKNNFTKKRVFIQFSVNSNKKTASITHNQIIQDKWPFPDEFLFKKDTKRLTLKNAISNINSLIYN